MAWRRLYPVPYRVLEDSQQFGRWNWIRYEFTSPANDSRRESQKVVPESISVVSSLKDREKSTIACALTRESIQHAASLNETLTLIKPSDIRLSWRRKSDVELSDERQKHADLVRQTSMFDRSVKPLEPCPYEFTFKWKSEFGTEHNHTCDDWETSTAFFRRRKQHGEIGALNSLRDTYEGDYLSKGMRFALGTHSRRSSQWLLVGVLRVDDPGQGTLGF